jgi:glutathione-specific gamma-glutamylcyclotransferase
MWDDWESGYGCSRKCIALLRGYRRTFNKASTYNRGTKKAPCPTLNLKKEAAATCKGMAFEFRDERRGDVLNYLGKREGADFQLELLSLRLDDDTEVQAYVPVYHGKNLVSSAGLKEKAAMVRDARRTESSCADYVKEIAELLSKLKIDDPAVTELWQEVQRQALDNK